MKKVFTLILLAISYCMVLPLNAQNLITGWDGNGVTGTSSKPSDVGWLNAAATTASLWNTANASGGCRFRDSGVTGGYTANSITYENAETTYLTSRLLMVRWDNNSYSTSYYAYPVTLGANTTYNFSMDYFYGGSGSAGLTLTAGISTTVDNAGQISSKTFTSTTVNVIRNGVFTFTTGATAGIYYITFNGAWAWFGVANLNLVKSADQLTELNAQFANLTLGNLSAVTSNLTLPTTLGTNGVTVRWASSNPAVIDTLGNVKQHAVYDAVVNLTATLSQVVDGTAYTLTKVFAVKVPGITGTPTQIAEWNFTADNITLVNDTLNVKDVQSGFTGKLLNDARIRTIGKTTQYNVLDLGNGTGYFDMGTDIGKAIYSLNDYTMMGFFRIDASYPSITSNGNFYWTFSNTNDAMTNQTGYIIGSLKAESQSVSTNYYATGNQATGPTVAASAPIGAWHHFAYVQSGKTGTIYIDGSSVGTNTAMTNLPSVIAKAGLTGTLYNWLGRSNYVSDVYLRKTLLYDFQLLSVPVSSDDLNLGFTGFDGVQSTLDNLNNAYAEDSDYTAPELSAELNNLTLGDLSAVKTDLTLPSKGTIDPTISIIWKTTNAGLITSTGVVTRPNYYNYNDTLTATLTKNGQSLVKKFPATVILKDGSQFSNNLLVKYDFSSVADSIVTDAAEKHFTGTLKNNAKVISIGSTIKYNVLSLGDSIGYFDMGTEVGKLIYNLTDYTVGAYFRIDTDYLGLSKNGNFLWNFSNSNDIANVPTGYIIASLRNQAVTISPSNYTSEQTVLLADSASKSSWHHFAYTQSGTTGTLYVDGTPMMSDTITSLPSTTLPKSGQLGTLYNWIGRSCYASDVNLRKTLVYDFRLYKTALTDEQIQNSVLNVGSTINALDFAYQEDASALKTVTDSRYKVISTVNEISILGLNGTEKISIFDISGRQLKMTNASSIIVNAGAYIVKIDNYVTKVMVK